MKAESYIETGINWAVRLDPNSKEYIDAVQVLYMAPKDQLSDDNGNPPYPHFQHKKIDVRNLVYEYNWMNQYALRGNTAETWNRDNSDVDEGELLEMK